MTDRHPLVRLETLALVGIGGFAGANLRFFAVGSLPDDLGILLANVVGSAILGFLVYEAQYADVLDRRARLAFTTGFLSSLTTYSGFALGIADAPTLWLALAILAGNYVLGFTGVLVGRAVAFRVSGLEPTEPATGPTRGDGG
ncbi:fluoride efflux transporter FluC [Natrarchaeobaculum aegyptiacum]|uniref:Fluoride-specific ion channel FluC n=1 Tax=Natrarchaeobaculum aegyptiacum TaxID=745377 RepID=A0A2Z2I3D9_9EURY|nr:CrcB family protein [Natrarchaeobaculum aegyptiacum]ARS91798.1 chromosome condensation protein CrcB [Natrarchaeobaculum aegyptiacum]